MVYKPAITNGTEAYRTLRAMIAHGELQPGQKVSQRRLAKQLGCSTVPILEAMRRLESDGLLITAPHCMARVRELNMEDLEGLYHVREGLEAVAARRAATRADEACLTKLLQLSDQFDAALDDDNRAAMAEADVAFHRLLANCAQCNLLQEELERLTLIERTAGQAARSSTRPESSHSSHRALVQAISDHDADAAEYFMKKHIQAGYRDLVETNGEAE